MKTSLLISLTLLISICVFATDAVLREATPIIPVEVTEKLIVQPGYAKFGEPAAPLRYFKLEANGLHHPFVYLHPVDAEDYNRIDEGDWIPIYQEYGPILGVLYKTVVILED